MNPEIRASCLTGCTESTSSPISFQPKNWDLLKEREKAQKRNKWDFTLGGIIGLLRILHLKKRFKTKSSFVLYNNRIKEEETLKYKTRKPLKEKWVPWRLIWLLLRLPKELLLGVCLAEEIIERRIECNNNKYIDSESRVFRGQGVPMALG